MKKETLAVWQEGGIQLPAGLWIRSQSGELYP